MSPTKMVEMLLATDGRFCRANCWAKAERVNDEGIAAQIAHLKIEHRDLDAAIEALRVGGSSDQLQVARLKKRKLLLKDEIAALQDQLVPDIIA